MSSVTLESCIINSLTFNEQPVEELNAKIAEEIDPRLYLATEYNPKRISSNTSSEHAFWIAVTNIYGFFFDCAGYVKDNYVLNLLDDKDKIKNFMELIKMRHLFCHNMSPNSRETDKHLDDFNKFLKEQVHQEVAIPYELSLSSKEWEKMTRRLSIEFQQCFDILSKSIDEIAKHSQKEEIVNKWLNAIVKWYERSSYFTSAGFDCYDYLAKDDNYNLSLGERKSWINQKRKLWTEDDYDLPMKYIKTLREPIFPYETLRGFFLNEW